MKQFCVTSQVLEGILYEVPEEMGSISRGKDATRHSAATTTNTNWNNQGDEGYRCDRMRGMWGGRRKVEGMRCKRGVGWMEGVEGRLGGSEKGQSVGKLESDGES
jgi:hypothetical protein